MDAHFARGRYGALVFCLLVVLVSALNSQVNPGAQVFRPSSFQSGSRTGGIQEAIDAAAKAGGARCRFRRERSFFTPQRAAPPFC